MVKTKYILNVICFIVWIFVGMVGSRPFFVLFDKPPFEHQTYSRWELDDEGQLSRHYTIIDSEHYDINTWALMLWFLYLSGLGVLWGYINSYLNTWKWGIDEGKRFKNLFPWSLIYPTASVVIILIFDTIRWS